LENARGYDFRHRAILGSDLKGWIDLRSIELFAGAGGLAIGTSRAGFHHEAVLEWDHNACQTLRLNRAAGHGHCGDWNVIRRDISEYDFKPHHGGVEFVSGGPPCQPFSLGGKHRGHVDQRNMFPHAVRAVREIQPKAFIFENVKGLLRKNFANYYSYIIHQLRFPDLISKGDEEWTDHLARLEKLATGGRHKGLSYNVVYRLMNAADYGVPQHRYRVLIVGVRSDLEIEFSFPERTHEEDALLYDQWISGEYWERHKISKKRRPPMPKSVRHKVDRLGLFWRGSMSMPWRTTRDAIADLPQVGDGKSSPKISDHFLNPGARSYPGHTGSPYDEPAKALKAGDHGVPGGENMLRMPDGAVRYFSVRECARIQTFPDEWKFAGSWTESMRQLGNAVPVLLAETVAKRLASVVGFSKKGEAPPRPASSGESRPDGKPDRVRHQVTAMADA
jgi:DNA (cytosine-5)-methyltransferase 1